jgi:hypothetical protein
MKKVCRNNKKVAWKIKIIKKKESFFNKFSKSVVRISLFARKSSRAKIKRKCFFCQSRKILLIHFFIKNCCYNRKKIQQQQHHQQQHHHQQQQQHIKSSVCVCDTVVTPWQTLFWKRSRRSQRSSQNVVEFDFHETVIPRQLVHDVWRRRRGRKRLDEDHGYRGWPGVNFINVKRSNFTYECAFVCSSMPKHN